MFSCRRTTATVPQLIVLPHLSLPISAEMRGGCAAEPPRTSRGGTQVRTPSIGPLQVSPKAIEDGRSPPGPGPGEPGTGKWRGGLPVEVEPALSVGMRCPLATSGHSRAATLHATAPIQGGCCSATPTLLSAGARRAPALRVIRRRGGSGCLCADRCQPAPAQYGQVSCPGNYPGTPAGIARGRVSTDRTSRRARIRASLLIAPAAARNPKTGVGRHSCPPGPKSAVTRSGRVLAIPTMPHRQADPVPPVGPAVGTDR
jgi:hypothetical protein